MTPKTLKKLLWAGLFLVAFHGFSQEYNSFDVRYQNNIKGDLTFIANSIVNRDGGTSTTEPEDAYDNLNTDPRNRSSNRNPETGGLLNVNDYKNMQYIDVDNDTSTFSSSTAAFAFPDPDCNAIRYAGLYWSATYPSETANGFYDGSTYNANTVPVGTGRQNDFNQVRLKIPGGSYVDITADEILFDGFTSTDPSVRQNSPYACYADVTHLLTPLANPAGDYTVANIRSVTGSLTPGGGAAGGWTLAIVYENPNLSGKLITTFDGFARVRDTDAVNINYSGFTTIPAGPVNADIGAATLEGDFRIDGDYMNIRASSNVIFSRVRDENGNLDPNNFFNSDITLDGVVTTNRDPNSINTLGYDTDMFRLLNPANSVIPNSETSATFQFRTDGDQYYPFFNSFNIEIIEPNIVLEKKVEDIAGNDITGQGVHLGQVLDYVLSFENIGNDDATDYTIRDVLPINVTLDEGNISMPSGTTYTFDPATREVIFTIPDYLINAGDPVAPIRMRVQVAENCFDFIDACTDLIQNLAYSTYRGVINDNEITDDPSVTDFDNCGFITPGATNFLLDDLSDCNFTRTVQLCGDNVVLDAGDNFDEYVWKRDDNGNGQFDATDSTLNDGDPDNDPSTLLVTQEGTYIVDKIVADPCKGFKEIMVVERFGNNRTNPIIEYYNDINSDADPTNDIQGEIVQCSVDGDFLPKIFLCGANDSQPIQINVLDAQSMSWERLDEDSCLAAPDDCANKSLSCTWNQIATGNDYTATTPGKYRLVINYQNGCFNRYYFDVFQNTLDIQYNKTDILCGNDGNITITNLGNNYGYQLVNVSTNAIVVPFSANGGPSFDISNNGSYRVDVVQLDSSGDPIDGACVFSTPDIGVLDRVFQVDADKTDASCTGFGAIRLSALNAVGQYYYEVSQGGNVVDTFGPSNDNTYSFTNLNPGIYDYRVYTDDGCDSTGQIEIIDNTDLELDARVSQHITCREGNIQMNSDGGKTPHVYAIWSYVDDNGNTVTSYNNPSGIPASEYQTSQIFDILDPGSYSFIVVDRNNCVAFSNTVEIEFRPAAEFNATSIIDVSCFNESSGSIQFNLINDNGYRLNYYLFDASSFDEDNFNHADALATNGTGNFPGLPSGEYVVVINQRKGSADCDYFEYNTISAPSNELEATSALVQNYTCTQDAIIEAQNVSGGTAPYSYSIDGVNFIPDTTPNAHRFENLTNGTYTITVRDDAGCSYPTDPITLDPLNQPSDLTFSATPPTCPAETSDVTVTVTDGNPLFTYEIVAPAADAVNNGNSNQFAGLDPGTYTFRITDEKNCTIQQDFTIAPVNRISALGLLDDNITCFGQSDGALTFNVTDFTTSYDYSVSGPSTFSATAQTTNTVPLTGLPAGTYTITVTDTDTNCTDTASVEVEGPNAVLTLSANETQPSCNSDGSVVLTASEGWGGYSYTLTNPDSTNFGANSNGSFTGLTQTGTYTATVTDANNCVVSITFEIAPAVAPVLAITPNAVCYADTNGLTLTANVTSGGDGNFEYNLNGGSFSTSNVFAGLTPGTYSISVRDGKDCTDTETITIAPELTVTASADGIPACGTDADISVAAAGGDGNYVYAVVADGAIPGAGDFAATNPVTVTGTGGYDVYVRDNAGAAPFCEASYDITVAQDPPVAISETHVDVTCFGGSDGSISLTAGGGEAPYTYSIDGGATFGTPDTFNNLTAGSYDARARDANDCEVAVTVTVGEPAQLMAEALQTEDYTCLQLGEITVGSVTPTSGGSGDYQYSINGGAWTTATTGGAVFPDLTDGTYSIRVRDANNTGCSITLPDLIVPPLPVEPVLSTSVAYNCDGTGNITVLPNDPSYTYSIDGSPAQPGNVFNDIATGSHTITVDYGSDCTVDTTVDVQPGNAFEATITAFEDLDCNGDASGSITFAVDNFGPGGFEYSLDNFATTLGSSTTSPQTISGLAAGNHTVTVRDLDDPVAACAITLNQSLSEPPVLVASASVTEPFTCNNSGATISASATGGTPNYTYQLEDNIGAVITTYQSNTSFGGLTAGDYIIRVRDTNLCTDPIDVPVTVTSPSVTTFDLTATACYSGNNDATIQVDVTAGNGNYLFRINGSALVAPMPTNSTTYTFTGLSSGTYTIEVTDQYGCDAAPQNITIAPELTVTASADGIPACGTDADISVAAAGGDGNYVYAVVADGAIPGAGDFAATNPVTVTGTGGYDVYVRDNAGAAPFCEASYDITVAQDPPVAISETHVDVTCFGGSDGSISLTAGGGEAPYTYSIDGGATFGTPDTFNNLTAGSYDARARDANDCEVAVTVTVGEPAQLMAEALQTEDYTCLQLGEITVGSVTPTSGGSGDYQYSINGGAWTTATTGGAVFPDLTDGTYSIRVRDANNTGCSITLPDLIVPPLPVEPVLSTSVAYNCDGTGNITVLPNDPSYTYSIDGSPAQPGNVFNDIATGSHTITVDYGSDCTVDTTVDVQPGNAFEATITAFEDLDCNGDASGSITFAVDNFGPGGFEYSLDNFATTLGSSTTSPQTISGLAAGNHTVTVRDLDDPVAACAITLNQSLSEPGVLTASNVTTQPTCVEDGSVIITANGGTGGFTYQITQPDTTVLGPQGSSLFTGLTQLGLHTILVTDTNGCTVTDTFTLTAPSTPVASIDPASDLCYSSSNTGSATVVVGVSGGTGPFYYNINGGPARTSNTFTDLIPGNYTFGIRDSNGCTDDIAFTIEPQLTANVVLTKDIDCSVSPDAILDISVNGGYAPFTYELDIDGAGYSSYTGGFPFTTGTPGVYRFRVTDSQGCIATSNEVEVTPTVNPVATATLTDPTCNGDTNGIIEINVDPNFGSSPYQISFEGSAFSNQTVYSGLTAGTYSYMVMDSRNCTYTDSVTLTDPALFDANVTATDVSCGGAGVGDVPGKIDINITSGGVPNFTYTLYDNQNNIVPVTGANPIINTAATSVTFDGLDFGDYYVRILDANGCEYYENPVRVLASPFLTLDTTVIVDCATGGTVEVTADSGSGNYTFSIYDAANTPPDTVNPGAGTDETAIFNGLNAGQSYIFRVIDNDTGCSSYVEADIPALSGINMVADPVVTDVSCFGDTNGTITFQIEGFDTSVTDIDYEIRENVTNTPLGAGYSGTVTQSAGGPTATPSETVSNIPPGDYVLFFREATSPFCSNTYEFRILEPNPVALSLVDQNNGSCNQDANVTVLASGGNGSYTYAFVEDGTAPVAGDYTPNNYVELDPSVNTDWDVYVLDGNGCTIPPLNIVIAEDPSPVISGVVINQCAAEEGDFIIEITLDTEGITPYSLSLNGGSFQSSTLTTVGTTHQFTNLSSGNYTVQVRDFNGCGNQIPLEIFTPTSVSAEVTTQPTCLGNDGEALITAYGGSGFYMYELFNGGVSVTGAPQASPAFTGLNSGVYTAFVYDQVLTGCDASINIELEVPRAVVFTASSTPVSCFGANDGNITAVLDPSMDNPPYTYQLFERNGLGILIAQGLPQASNIFNNLPASTAYIVRVYSGRGCQEDADVIIGTPAIIDNVTATVTEFGCSAGNNPDNAVVTVDTASITGGSGNYVVYEFVDDKGTAATGDDTVLQSGPSSVLTVTDTAGASITINVYDDNGCQGTTTATVLPFDEMLAAAAAVTGTLTCSPGNDGEITVTATSTAGDATRYEYSIDNGTSYQVSNVFDGLAAGTHNFLVRHVDNGCTVTATATLEEPNTFTVEVTKTSDVICFGTNTGEVTFELIDATYPGGFDWEVFDTNGTPLNLADDTSVSTGSEATNGPTATANLPAGEYYVSVTQTNNPFCTNIEHFNIAGPDMDITATTNVEPITCIGNDGAIEITNVTGGWGGYTYFVGTSAPTAPADFLTSPRFENLAVGTYEAWIRDSEGCERMIQNGIGLTEPALITAALQVNQENCTNLQGEIEVTGTTGGQNANYTYQLIKDGADFRAPQNTTVFGGLGAGTYQVRITDQWSCSAVIGTEILYEEMNLTTTVVKPIDCTVNPGGEITVNILGGSGNLRFDVTYPDGTTADTNNNGIFTGLAQIGTYSFVVTDLDTTNPVCTKTITETLNAPIDPVFTETHTDISCNGANDGSITLSQTENGVNPLTYTISPVAGTYNASTSTFENLPPNTYSITATGTNGCDRTLTGIIIDEPAIIDNVGAAVLEFGCSAGNNPDNATVTVDTASITGGSGSYLTYEFVDDNGTASAADDTVLQSGTSNLLTVTDTAGVNLIINVYDDNGCSGSTTATVLPFDEMLGATAAVTNTLTCSPGNDGEITISTTSTNNDTSRFEYSIDNGATYQASNVFGGLATDTHNFLVRHIDTGCILPVSETLAEPNTFTIDVAKTGDVICFGTATGEVTFELVDATYPGGFDWEVFDTNGTPTNFTDDASVASGNEPTANGPTGTVNLSAGEYYVSVTQANNPFCNNIEYFNIAGPDAAIAGSTAVTQITCVPGNDGSIEITGVAGGWGGYTYYVGTAAPTAPGDFVAGPLFVGLAAGTYQAWARDAMGCEELVQDNIVLDNPAPITAVLQVDQENCTNLQGEIQVVGTTGGQESNYTYQLVLDGADFRAPQNTTVFAGLGAGSYLVRVTDQWGCTFTTAAQLLYEEMELTATVAKPIDCTAAPGGDITIAVNGGSANLEFTVTMPDATTATQNNGTFTGLTQVGTYSFTVRDLDTANPVCQKTIAQQLDPPVNPVLLDATITDVSCFGGSDGSIRANIDPTTDVNPVYQYELYEISDLVTPISGPQADPLFTGLPIGDYQVKVISGRGCEDVKNETISQPTELTINASATAFSCDPNNSVNTATVTITVLDGSTTPGVTSGTPQYLYSIDNVNFKSSNIFEIIDNGTVRNITAYVTDGNSCSATATPVTIQPLNQFNATVSQISAISCSGPEEVRISIADDGNPHTYTFDLLPVGNPSGVQTATTATTADYDLASVGSYTFRVTDNDTGCYVDTAPYEIAPYDLIEVTTTATSQVTCFGDTGTLQIDVSGYSGAYDYEVFRIDGTTTGVSGNSNTTTNPFEIPDPTSVLTGGSYFVRVVETASPGCSEDSNNVTIISPDMPLTAVVNPLGEPTCTDDQGEILVDPSGGYAPYNIVLTNTTTGGLYTVTDVQAHVFTGLSAGNFTIEITDNGPAPGCTITDTEVLDTPDPIIANAIPLVTDLNCFDDTNGSVTAIVTSGGSGSYEYQLNYYDETATSIEFTSGQQSSDTFTGLGEGIYSVTVVDGWNCDVETNQVRINDPTEVTSNLVQTAAMTCTGDAELVLTASGGTGPYRYSADNLNFLPMSGGDTHTFSISQGSEGTYQYYVIDAQGCEANISNGVGVEAVPQLILNVDTSAAVINCTGENTAIIYADAEGGLGDYRYELYNAYNGASLNSADRIVGPKVSGTFADLSAGTYYVNVISGDCTAPPREVNIIEPVPLTYNDSVTNVTCSGENDGSITVTLDGGSGGYQYAISPNLDQFNTENVFDELAGSPTGLTYTVIAQDQKGCFIELQYTIFEPQPLDATATTTSETCEGDVDGSISILISGGTAPFRTSLNNADNFIQDRLIYTDIAPGPYFVYVRDANDCEYVVSAVVDQGINLNATVEPIYGCNGDIPNNYVNILLEDETVSEDVVYALDSTDPIDMQLNPFFRDMTPGQHYIAIASTTSGCVKTYDFEIMEFEPLTLTLQQNNINEITAIAAGGRESYTFYFGDVENGSDNTFVINRTDTYVVTVVDENGCEAKATIEMEFIDIEIPNFFTPNGDNENDFWKPRNIDRFPKILIKIYDRYGRVVAHVSQGHRGWDGLYKDRELPSGDYWYVVRLNGENDDREFVGHFTLYR